MDARNAGLIQDFRVASFVLPLDAVESTEAVQVKSVDRLTCLLQTLQVSQA